MTPRILAFSGSLRTGSYNHLLVQNAANGAKAAGAEVTVIRLADFNLPLFDEDLEAKGTPDGAKRLKELMKSHHGLLIASPEYNSSVTAALKNAIDWASRPPPTSPLRGKPVGMVSAAAGMSGGMRAQYHLRQILVFLNTFTLNKPEVFIGAAHTKFNAEGELTDEMTKKMLQDQLVALQALWMKVR